MYSGWQQEKQIDNSLLVTIAPRHMDNVMLIENVQSYATIKVHLLLIAINLQITERIT